ncbi:hypothetical protein [Actinoplanes sp. N902-109]|uniref:hypothetical protein n=1 Tax=Actinoplanes sp. (strain N902-109) TaxID=649831 RepID=UPI0003294E21|nr:hypothetical protein [Actinoplanes sp. N902-109]AGL19264.1 hypothetical protein L083_5754 [Actinoplanes sp. N902-109]
MLERMRSSLPEAEKRISFLPAQIEVYDLLVSVRVCLGRPASAYDAIQLVRSRALVDLLAQSERRPIEHGLELRARGVEADRIRWIADHVAEPRLDPFAARLLEKLQAAIDRRARHAVITEERRSRGLFEKLTRDAEQPLRFDAVRALLR